MDIRITITAGELREQGLLEAFCELFHADINTLPDKQLCALNYIQAQKIGLQISKEPVSEAPKAKRGRKSKA